MIELYNDFLGINPNTRTEWSGMDSEEQFAKSLLSQPKYWYYRDKKITYSYNSTGHRCKNFSDVNLDNYLLFSGCSYTEGVGLELEKTYPFVVSERLGCDYYNLAIGGTGIDVVTYNILTWIGKVKSLPKAIIIQWPEITRVVSSQDGLRFEPNGVWNSDYDTSAFINTGLDIGFFSARDLLNRQLIRSVSPVPVIILGNIATPGKVADYARDCAHPGITANKASADLVCAKLKPFLRS